MAKVNCSACDELRQDAPNVVVNGLGDTECASLKNDTGLNPSSGNNDCTDLENMNDCFIGNMESEIERYNICNWKDYMRKFIHNAWTMYKSIICAICGIWTNISNLWKKVNKHECEIDYLFKGASFSFGENTEGKSSKIVPGKGVDFSLRQASEEHSTDVTLTYIAGGLMRVSGALRTFIENFQDANKETRSGNTVWNFTASDFELPKGGELLYEIRIKKSEYPQIKRLFAGDAFPSGGRNEFYQAHIIAFDGDRTSDTEPTIYAYGQHGWCDSDGTPSEDGYSAGHAVPKGWFYVQIRMYATLKQGVYDVKDGSGATKRGTNFTPQGYLGVRMDRDEITC